MSLEPMSHTNVLEYIETHALIAELARRFDQIIFASRSVHQEGFLKDGVQPNTNHYERWYYKGDLRICQSLAFSVSLRLGWMYESTIAPIRPDEWN